MKRVLSAVAVAAVLFAPVSRGQSGKVRVGPGNDDQPAAPSKVDPKKTPTPQDASRQVKVEKSSAAKPEGGNNTAPRNAQARADEKPADAKKPEPSKAEASPEKSPEKSSAALTANTPGINNSAQPATDAPAKTSPVPVNTNIATNPAAPSPNGTPASVKPSPESPSVKTSNPTATPAKTSDAKPANAKPSEMKAPEVKASDAKTTTNAPAPSAARPNGVSAPPASNVAASPANTSNASSSNASVTSSPNTSAPASNTPTPSAAASNSAAPAAVAPPTAVYRVGIGDVLDIRLVNQANPPQTLFTVMAGGLLEYPLAGDPVVVSGMTAEEIAARLASGLKKRAVYERPQVVVSVHEYASHAVLVSGMVGDPGTKILRREAVPLYVVLAEAQPHADAGRAIIISHTTGQSTTVDLADAAALNTLVHAGDVVNVQVRPKEFFYIGGEIAAGGQKDFHAGLTLTQALLASGGATRLSSGRVKVARQGADGRLSTTEYSLKEIEEGRVPDPRLQPGDRIEVVRKR